MSGLIEKNAVRHSISVGKPILNAQRHLMVEMLLTYPFTHT